MKDNKEKKEIVLIDDSVDIGKHPLPIGNPEAQKLHEELMKKYKVK